MEVVHLAALCPVAELDSFHHHAVMKRERSQLLGLKQRVLCHAHLRLVTLLVMGTSASCRYLTSEP